jgi:hypothetical protein
MHQANDVQITIKNKKGWATNLIIMCLKMFTFKLKYIVPSLDLSKTLIEKKSIPTAIKT